MTPKENMAALNRQMSATTAYSTWRKEWHTVNMEYPAYADLFNDMVYLVRQNQPRQLTEDEQYHITLRIFYIMSTSPSDTISLATVVSKLDVDCPQLVEGYQANLQAYSDLVYTLQSSAVYSYMVTMGGHPIVIPNIVCRGPVRTELDDKFFMALPQVGSVVEELTINGKGITPGVRFTGKSTKRKTPLNKHDRAIISLVSRQKFTVDMDIVRNMEYYVPTITDTGFPISEREQEDARTAYYRFTDMAEIAEERGELIQFPTTQDSRGRFYNLATDPSIRLSLRAPTFSGNLTLFEKQLLEEY